MPVTVIVDPVCPQPYSLATLQNETLGGTEATVVRIAEGLDALVVQHNRTTCDGRYLASMPGTDLDNIIVLRDPLTAIAVKRQHYDCQVFLWLHDLAGPETDRGRKLSRASSELSKLGIQVIAVSDYHAAEIRRSLSLSNTTPPEVIRIYNPVETGPIEKAADSYDPDKLVFFSSPHKGLNYTLTVFSHMRRQIPSLKLFIANPGYQIGPQRSWPNVVNLGSIPHRSVLSHVAEALCTFYPNYIYPETFGLVLAESNAVGTPVLTHEIGAAPEILADRNQFVQIPLYRGVLDSIYWRSPCLQRPIDGALGRLAYFNGYTRTIRSWRSNHRPNVSMDERFRLSHILGNWKAHLQQPQD